MPTESIVDYSLSYNFDSSDLNDAILKKQIETYNFGALSAWNKLRGEGRPDFIKAYYALINVFMKLDNSDIPNRLLAFNLFHLGMKDFDFAYN
jgi:hypothetical protein